MLIRLALFLAFVLAGLASPALAEAPTRLGPGDRLIVALPGEAAFEAPVAIGAEGRILLPEVGEVGIGGLTLPEARAHLRAVLGEVFLSAAQLDLRLVERRLLIRVLGHVETPGLVDIAQGETVQVAVAAAGGPRLGAQLDRYQHRRGDAVTEFNYKRYLETGDDGLLPKLRSLDTIFIPASPLLGNVAIAVDSSTFESAGDSGDAARAVSVFGEVVRHGAYSWKDGMTPMDAILRAGGVTRYAGVEQIRVITGGEPRPFNLKDYLDTGDPARMPAIGAGAILFVPSEAEGVAASSRTVYLMGEVQKPGAYELGADAGMLDVLANAGGPTRHADARNIRILRADGAVDRFDLTAFSEGPGGPPPAIRPGDAIFLPEAAEDAATSWLSVPSSRAIYLMGAVARPGRYEWSGEMTLLDLLAQGGGPTAAGDASAIEISIPGPGGGFERLVFDLDAFRAGGLPDDLPAVAAGSVVLVPELPQDPADNKSRYILQSPDRSIYILGAVQAPGRYAFEPALSLLDVLSAAGGPMPDADLRAVRHVRTGEVADKARTIDLSLFFKTGDPAVLPALAAGDALYVPSVERPFIDQAPEDTVRVLGAVAAPGRYIFTDEMTILDLLAQAGGPTENALNRKIVVVNLSCCRDQARSFNLTAFARKGDMSLLPVVRPGDTVYVPDRNQTGFRRFMGSVTDITQILSLVAIAGGL